MLCQRLLFVAVYTNTLLFPCTDFLYDFGLLATANLEDDGFEVVDVDPTVQVPVHASKKRGRSDGDSKQRHVQKSITQEDDDDDDDDDDDTADEDVDGNEVL